MSNDERLQRFEQVLEEVENDYRRVSAQVDEMKAQGKTKTATFQQVLARKVALKQFLGIFEQHDLR